MINKKRILVLAPHTDDGELGLGGSIARRQNDAVVHGKLCPHAPLRVILEFEFSETPAAVAA